MRWWWLHFGQTLRFCSRSVLYSTVSQAGHLIHRPSGTERRSLGSVCWILGGNSFSNQLIHQLLGSESSALRMSAMKRLLAAATFSRDWISSNWTMADPMTTASETAP